MIALGIIAVVLGLLAGGGVTYFFVSRRSRLDREALVARQQALLTKILAAKSTPDREKTTSAARTLATLVTERDHETLTAEVLKRKPE